MPRCEPLAQVYIDEPEKWFLDRYDDVKGLQSGFHQSHMSVENARS